MIFHCCECGKAISNKLDHCPYCRVGFLNHKKEQSKEHFFQKMMLSLRSLFF